MDKCFFVSLFLLFRLLEASSTNILICGIAKNIIRTCEITKNSCQKLCEKVDDYRIIIYENNSTDGTKDFLKSWAEEDSKVIFLSENLSGSDLELDRVTLIARARNKVLDVAMKSEYDSFPIMIMADLDMHPWDVEEILYTIHNKEYSWDAVFAYGGYDLFAFRTKECLIGYELVGHKYWSYVPYHYMQSIECDSLWKPVLSAFGGLGIYKREAIAGCRYSSNVTKDLEIVIHTYLKKALKNHEDPLAKVYLEYLATVPIIGIRRSEDFHKPYYFSHVGIKLAPPLGLGKVVWFTEGLRMPSTCEHVTFHAAMIARKRNRLYINPNLKSYQF